MWRLPTDRIGDSNIQIEIPIMEIPIRAQKKLNKVANMSPEKTYHETIEPLLPVLDKLLRKKEANTPCSRTWPTLEVPQSTFTFDQIEPLVINSAIDRSLRKAVPESMCTIISHLCYYLTLSGHQEERIVSDIFQLDYN